MSALVDPGIAGALSSFIGPGDALTRSGLQSPSGNLRRSSVPALPRGTPPLGQPGSVTAAVLVLTSRNASNKVPSRSMVCMMTARQRASATRTFRRPRRSQAAGASRASRAVRPILTGILGLPVQASSSSPSTRSFRKRRSHLPTVSSRTPSSAATTLLAIPSAQRRINPASLRHRPCNPSPPDLPLQILALLGGQNQRCQSRSPSCAPIRRSAGAQHLMKLFCSRWLGPRTRQRRRSL